MLRTTLLRGRRSQVLAVVFGVAAVAVAGAVARADSSNDEATSAGPTNALRDLRELLLSQELGRMPPQPIGTITLDDATFEIHDFSFGAENPTTSASAGGGGGAGKVRFNEFTIKKAGDSASPVLFNNLIAGSHYGKVVIAMRKAGGSSPFLQYTFGTVLTTKIDWSGPGDEGPEENISFSFATIELTFQSQDSGVTTSGVFNTTQ